MTKTIKPKTKPQARTSTRTANQEYADAQLRRQIFLLHYSDGLFRRANAALAATERALAGAIHYNLRGSKGLRTPHQWAALNEALQDITADRVSAWNDVEKLLSLELLSLARQEVIAQDLMIHAVAPVIFSTQKDMPKEWAELILKQRPFQGATFEQWVKKLKEDDIRRITTTITSQMLQGADLTQITNAVIGTAESLGINGATQSARNELERITRTAVMAVSNFARRDYIINNADVITGEKFVATLDSRTTVQCASLDGKIYKVGEGPIPPLHFCCRSVRVPYLGDELFGTRPADPTTEQSLVEEFVADNGVNTTAKTREDLPWGWKTKFDRFARERVRALAGPIPVTTSYQDWLRSQSAQFQDYVLGKTKARLFRDGRLSLDKFIGANGGELTLKELARLERDAFKAAGLDPDKYLK
jgi:minor head protein-like